MASKLKNRRKPERKAAPPAPRPPASRVPGNLSVFRDAGIEIKQGAESTYPWTVAGRFYFWPATGMWRGIDSTRFGYGAFQLRRLIRDEAGPVAEAERQHVITEAAVNAVRNALDPIEAPPREELQDHQNEQVPT